MSTADFEIIGCTSCYKCTKTSMEHLCLGRGVRKDDANQLFKRMIDADGWLVGVPVYFGTIPAQFKALIDLSMAIQRDINHYQVACFRVGKNLF